MNTHRRAGLTVGLAALVCFFGASVGADPQEKVALAEIDQYDSKLVEVEGIPLVSTFKEDDGYGVWNLLIGQDEQKLLCYEDGTNIDALRDAHKDVEAIIEKNEDFKKEERELQSIKVLGTFDGENEILNLTEILYSKASTEYQVDTDHGDEPEEVEEDQEIYEDERPVEQYIIFHEVGRPWLHAPAWWHYPAWWGGIWVDVHWWWRPWYDCGLRWYRDRYCCDWRYRCYDPCGYCYDPGKPYRSYDRRRGLPRDRGVRYDNKQYRYTKTYRRDTYPTKEYRTPRKEYTTDRSRGIKPQQKTYRNIQKSIQPSRKTYRSKTNYSRPTIRSRPTRSYSRSSFSRPNVSRSSTSPRTTTRTGRRR